MSRSHNVPEHKYETYSHAKTAARAKMDGLVNTIKL